MSSLVSMTFQEEYDYVLQDTSTGAVRGTAREDAHVDEVLGRCGETL